MEEFDFYGRRCNVFVPQEMADWLAPLVRPNVAVTLTLLQGRTIHRGGEIHPIAGDENEYRWTANNLVHDLSRRYLGKAYKRYRKLVPHVVTLEGDGKAKRRHIHAAFRSPEHVGVYEFMKSIRFYWSKSPWQMGDNTIELITGNWLQYILKEGSEALLCAGGF